MLRRPARATLAAAATSVSPHRTRSLDRQPSSRASPLPRRAAAALDALAAAALDQVPSPPLAATATRPPVFPVGPLCRVFQESRVGESTRDQEDGGGDDHDFEDRVGNRHSGGARDGEDHDDEVQDDEDQEGGYHEGAGHQGQFVYVNSDDEVKITRAGAGLITPAFYERMDTADMSWRKVSETTKEFYYREFKKNARVDLSIDEGRLRKVFLKKAAERYANFMYNQRNPTRLKKKKKDPRPFEQLKKKKSGPVQLDEVIIHTKTKKHDDKTWVDPEHAELQAQFFELREEARQKGLQVTDQEIWYSLVEGHNVKNRVPGVGDYEREMRKMNLSSKPRRSSTSSSSAAEMAALKEQNQRLQEQIDNLTSSLSLTIQEEIRRLYGGNLPRRGDDDVTGGVGHPGIC
ncbi:unnamed protein product [Cuscuta campestris]|uniref:Uncharacterized protein n=1 Tax=Cuscuta campestris TaxID=132261 RepID=A0A484MAF3_9ASTE|nr:unnamed protein product [Cuscuta campestris]